MLKLKKLELIGFKSFADRTRLEFQRRELLGENCQVVEINGPVILVLAIGHQNPLELPALFHPPDLIRR